MHKEILTKEQLALLPFLKSFNRVFGLVGGTAIALYLGHRESIDFDLASRADLDNAAIRRAFKAEKIEQVARDDKDEFTFFIRGVKFTFFHYPFDLKFSVKLNGVIKFPDLATLAAMKAYALGRRAKWKDYVDLYFIFKRDGSIAPTVKAARKIFGREFNEKNLRSQLAYFKDIDYSEKIIYKKGFFVKDGIIKKELTDFSLK